MTLFRERPAKIHFVGIGGIGMSGIAEVLLNLGYRVSGSDLRRSDTTRRLEALGGLVREGHAAEQVAGVDVVVVSSAVRRDNPEVVEARRRQIPVIPRAEMLAELMRLKYGVAIAGSHGKTTTTSLAAHLLAQAGLDPTAVVGGKVNAFGSNAKLGKGEYMVVEADESDGSFLRLSPAIAVVTNIDPEHLDHWKTAAALRQGFLDFVNRLPFYGLAILCIDHPTVQSLLPEVEKRFVTYGEAPQADYRASRIAVREHRVAFEAHRRGEPLGRFEVGMVGRHNALNALAVVALSDEMGIPGEVTRAALAASTACSGASRCAARRAGSRWWTTTGTTRPRCGRCWPARARPSGAGWSACSSPTATPAPATSGPSSPPPSTTPTSSSSATSTRPARSPSPASPARAWPRPSGPTGTAT